MGKNKEKAVFVGQEEHLRMESILYAFAMKFLNKEELVRTVYQIASECGTDCDSDIIYQKWKG